MSNSSRRPLLPNFLVIVDMVNGTPNWPFVPARKKMTMWVWSKIHRFIHITCMSGKSGDVGRMLLVCMRVLALCRDKGWLDLLKPSVKELI